MFEIDSTPFPARRIVASKYNDMFAAMRPGQSIKTEPENVGSIAAAMRILDPVVNGKPLSKSAQVRMIGNSVCAPLAAALVKANFAHERQIARAA